MDRRHTVDRKSVMNVDVRHMHFLVLVNDLHLGVLIFCSHTLVKLLDNRHKLRHYLFQIFQRPFFQCLCKNSMVGICAGFAHNFDRFIHGKRLFIHQNPDQFGNDHRRVRIVDLDYRMIIHGTQIVLLLLHLFQDQLGRIAHHKVLLINAQQITRLVGVIRIQKQRQILFNIFFIKINALLNQTFVDRLNIK